MFQKIKIIGLSALLASCIQIEQKSTISKHGEIDFHTTVDVRQAMKMQKYFVDSMESKKVKNKSATKILTDDSKSDFTNEMNCEDILEHFASLAQTPKCEKIEQGFVSVTGHLNASEATKIIIINSDKTMDIDVAALFKRVASLKGVQDMSNDNESAIPTNSKDSQEMLDLFDSMGMKVNMTIDLPGKVTMIKGRAVSDGKTSLNLNMLKEMNSQDKQYIVRVKPKLFLGLF